MGLARRATRATSPWTERPSPKSAARPGPGRREIDANGLLVTPGWVDVHTHYDGQATWDPVLAPSSWHGGTTILFGNCGVGFAPVRNEDHSALIGMMELIEEIPGIALADGLKWNWETFPQYLDALDQMPRAIDIAAQIPHHPLRVYVMGDRAINREAATADDIAAMRDAVTKACGPAHSASPPRAPTRTRRRAARWFRDVTPKSRSCLASGPRSRAWGMAHSA